MENDNICNMNICEACIDYYSCYARINNDIDENETAIETPEHKEI